MKRIALLSILYATATVFCYLTYLGPTGSILIDAGNLARFAIIGPPSETAEEE